MTGNRGGVVMVVIGNHIVVVPTWLDYHRRFMLLVYKNYISPEVGRRDRRKHVEVLFSCYCGTMNKSCRTLLFRKVPNKDKRIY